MPMFVLRSYPEHVGKSRGVAHHTLCVISFELRGRKEALLDIFLSHI